MIDDVIQQIKRRAEIVEVIQASGVGEFPFTTKEGKFRGQHGTHTARPGSCIINGKTNDWYCFSCGRGGDVVSWVLSTKFNDDKSRYREAVEWLAHLYSIPVTDNPLNIPRQQARQLLTELSWQWHEALLEDETHLNWVKTQWGLTDNTIEDLRIGFCSGIADAGYEVTQLRAAGLIDKNNAQPLAGRITFPFLKDGLVVWMAGRIPYQHDTVPKYTCLATTDYVSPTLYNFDNAYRTSVDKPIVFTEGLADAARAYQEGIRVVAPGGASMFTSAMHSDAELLLRNCSDYKYIVFDNEKSRTGNAGARRMAQALIGLGYDPYIVELPFPQEDTVKVDLADFLNTTGFDTLFKLMESAVQETKERYPRNLPYILIEECPHGAEPERVKTVLNCISSFSEAGAAKYIKELATKTKIPEGDLKKLIKEIQKKQVKVTRKVDYNYQAPPFLAQDFVYHKDMDTWRAHTCVFVPFMETRTVGAVEESYPVVRPVHIVVDMPSEGAYHVVRHEPLIDPPKSVQEKIPAKVVALEQFNRWSVDPKYPYSYTNFIENKTTAVDVGELYQRIYNLFDRYIWLPDPRDKYVLALYPFLTHIYMGLESVPYLHLNGPKSSGKSNLMQILGICCFNAAPSSTISPAVLYRIAEATRPTFIIDEAEKLKNPTAGTMAADLMDICLGSYANNEQARALRCGRDEFQPESFNTYSPKIFGCINELRDTLASRAIQVSCIQPKPEHLRELGDWDSDRVYLSEEFQEIRDRLRVWALTQFRSVRSHFNNVSRDRADFLLTRDRQIWRPVIALADMITENWGVKVNQIILELARDKIVTSKVKAATSEFGNTILIALHHVCKHGAETAGMLEKDGQTYLILSQAVKRIIEYLTQEANWIEGGNRLNANFLSGQLRQCQAVKADCKARQLRHDGALKRAVDFSFETLEDYLLTKGLIEENSNAD